MPRGRRFAWGRARSQRDTDPKPRWIFLNYFNDRSGERATVERWRQSRCIRAAEVAEYYTGSIADSDCIEVIRIGRLAVQGESVAYPDGRNTTVVVAANNPRGSMQAHQPDETGECYRTESTSRATKILLECATRLVTHELD